MNKAHVTHPELKATFNLDILGVKKNPNGAMYSSLGVITKGGLTHLLLLHDCSSLGLRAACTQGFCHGPYTPTRALHAAAAPVAAKSSWWLDVFHHAPALLTHHLPVCVLTVLAGCVD